MFFYFLSGVFIVGGRRGLATVKTWLSSIVYGNSSNNCKSIPATSQALRVILHSHNIRNAMTVTDEETEDRPRERLVSE